MVNLTGGLVTRKRPADITPWVVSYVSYLPEGDTIASVAHVVDGEADSALAVASTTIDGPDVTCKLTGGTAEAIYQVYLTATFTSGLKRTIQFEVDVERADG